MIPPILPTRASEVSSRVLQKKRAVESQRVQPVVPTDTSVDVTKRKPNDDQYGFTYGPRVGRNRGRGPV